MTQLIDGMKITVGGGIYPVQIDRAECLKSLYKEIDCTTVQYLGADHKIDVIIDEEGKITGKEPNDLATIIAMKIGVEFFPWDCISGDAVFLAHNGEGDTIGLNAEQQRVLKAVTEDC